MGGGGSEGPPFFSGFSRHFLESNRLSSGIVQPPQGCSCVLGRERGCILANNCFGSLFLNCLDPPLNVNEGIQCSFNEICPEMHVNEIHLPHNRHHKVSSLMKFHQNTQNYIKYEVYENV